MHSSHSRNEKGTKSDVLQIESCMWFKGPGGHFKAAFTMNVSKARQSSVKTRGVYAKSVERSNQSSLRPNQPNVSISHVANSLKQVNNFNWSVKRQRRFYAVNSRRALCQRFNTDARRRDTLVIHIFPLTYNVISMHKKIGDAFSVNASLSLPF